jgi:hypothetical protein
MAFTSPNAARRAAMLLMLAAVSGCCCQAIPLPGEQQCPTDARRMYWGCGEEAVRKCPCGPDRAFYGHKPTEWRSWPEGWNCGQHGWGAEGGCGEMIEADALGGIPTDRINSAFEEPFGTDAPAPEVQAPPETPAPPVPSQDESNADGPFRDDPLQLPLPEETPPAEEQPTQPESASPAPMTEPAPSPPPPPVEALPMSSRVEQHVNQNLAL